MTVNQTSVSLDDAQRVIAAGRTEADEIESPSNIAVIDAGGNLVAHVRMDGAWIASIDILISKAFTARALDISTEDLAADAGPGRAGSSTGYTCQTVGAS
ncbi:heme-binding protein [Rhodococcus sp. WB9]|uniref:GlcG/HbpS family heme-binding protein n=1 Tax=Rhodococcus sp. WB9 TaxID=2594007 RepID=UPI0021B39D62|nr:heme-binding protein [Rhodococcus sp. WB9]